MGWGKGASALLCLFLCLISETFGFCPVSSQSFLRQRQPVRSACFGLSVGVSPSPDEVVVERVAVSPSKVPSFDGLPSSLLSQEPLPSAATILRGDKDALDEAWALTDKFYLDRSFNGKDWSAVREKYRGLVNRYKPKNIGPLVGDMMNELGDPFSRWIDAQMYSDLQKFDLLGIGSPLSKGPDQKVRFIAPPVVGSPGEKAGVKSGDIVLEIAGSPVEGKNGFDILALVEKLPDPTYSIKVQPSDGRPQFEFSLARVRQDVSSPVFFFTQDLATPFEVEGTQVSKLGFMGVSEFDGVTKERVKEAVAAMEGEGVNLYVLDLRGNRGGNFNSAISTAGVFMDDRTVCFLADSKGEALEFRTDPGRAETKAPLVILTDSLTASASEVLTASLRDNCRAASVGGRTFGKGVVQAVYGLSDRSGLILTIAKYLTPLGKELQNSGIEADAAALRGLGPSPSSIIALLNSPAGDKIRLDAQKDEKKPIRLKADGLTLKLLPRVSIKDIQSSLSHVDSDRNTMCASRRPALLAQGREEAGLKEAKGQLKVISFDKAQPGGIMGSSADWGRQPTPFESLTAVLQRVKW